MLLALYLEPMVLNHLSYHHPSLLSQYVISSELFHGPLIGHPILIVLSAREPLKVLAGSRFTSTEKTLI